MTTFNPLSLDFISRRPATAARVLQGEDARQVARYLSEVPIRLLIPLIEAMESWPAARILAELPDEQVPAILARLSFPVTATLVRLQTKALQQAWMAKLSSSLTRQLARTLSYPEDAVGAWMNSSTPHFSASITVGECLTMLRHGKERIGSHIICVDDHHRIAGVVAVDQLLASPDTQQLTALLDRTVRALPAQMSVTVARTQTDWQRVDLLPVRDSHGLFAGTLSRKQLHDAALRLQSEPQMDLGDSITAHLIRAMSTSIAGMLSLISGYKSAADSELRSDKP